MYMLVLQIFLLMLAAFVLGAAFACMLKRTMHRFAGPEVPEEALHVEVPPAIQRIEPVPVQAPPVTVTTSETRRFERALRGDVAADPVESSPVHRGPVVEVQLRPEPPQSAPTPERTARAADTGNYAEVAVSSHDGSTLSPETVHQANLPPPRMPEPAAAPLPVPLIDLPPPVRPSDAVDGPDGSYVAEAITKYGSALSTGQTYAAIAVASHDGSTLPPPGVLEAILAPPVMPGPSPAALPVPRVDIPTFARPSDAPNDPTLNYVEEAIASGHIYVPGAEPPPGPDVALPGFDPDVYEVPPAGESYASIAVGGQPQVSAAASIEPSIEPGAAYETKSTHASNALAAAAVQAAQRAAGGPDVLTRIVGIDEVLASRMNYAGITRFAQIAAWDTDEVRRMSQTLGFFGRIEDEYWIDQAKLLAGESQQDARSAPAISRSYDTDPAGHPDYVSPGAAVAAAAVIASARSQESAATTHATPANAADIASAAAAAAAAALATVSRRDDDASEGATGSRPTLTGLRSVRAEALLGDDAPFVRGDLDDLKRIRGIGVLIEKKLNSLGITSYEQVANWSVADIERISDLLDFKGRIERENWIEQARILSSGGQTEFSRRVDRGEA